MNKSTAAFNALPATGLSVVQEFYTLGVVSLLLNMLGHVGAFRYENLAGLIGQITVLCGVLVPTLWLTASLHARGCTGQISPGLSGFFVAVAVLLVTASLSGSLYFHRNKLKNIRRYLQKSDRQQVSDDDEDEDVQFVVVKKS